MQTRSNAKQVCVCVCVCVWCRTHALHPFLPSPFLSPCLTHTHISLLSASELPAGLLDQIAALRARHAKLAEQNEREAQLSPEKLKEKLLDQVKADNQEISGMERKYGSWWWWWWGWWWWLLVLLPFCEIYTSHSAILSLLLSNPLSSPLSCSFHAALF